MTSNWTIVGLVIAAILLALFVLCVIVTLYVLLHDLRAIRRWMRSRDDDER